MPKQTSAQWAKEVNFTVIDPDGWDRKDFDNSWNVELITLAEFNKRAGNSTCMFHRKK